MDTKMQLRWWTEAPLLMILLVCSACVPTANKILPQKTVTVTANFQSQLNNVPSTPAYLCGAWASNDSPGMDSTITIYARLTRMQMGVEGALGNAVAHLSSGDIPLDALQMSDKGGYVTFTLPLQGLQARLVPAKISVSFTLDDGSIVNCAQAFFTPQ